NDAARLRPSKPGAAAVAAFAAARADLDHRAAHLFHHTAGRLGDRLRLAAERGRGGGDPAEGLHCPHASRHAPSSTWRRAAPSSWRATVPISAHGPSARTKL